MEEGRKINNISFATKIWTDKKWTVSSVSRLTPRSLRTQRKEGTVEGANLIKLGAEKGGKRGEERERGKEENTLVVNSHLDVSTSVAR